VMLAMGKRLDDAVGSILNSIEKNGLRDNTIIFFVSDNGGALSCTSENKPLRGGKHMDYEGGIRVPFFVSWPGHIKPGTTCDNPVIGIDILPTCLAAAGITPPAGTKFDGEDIMPIITGKTTDYERPLYWCGGSADPWWAIRKGDWKIVALKGDSWLFNVKKDISETTDVKAQNMDKFNELKALHDAWLAEMKDPVDASDHKVWTTDADVRKKGKDKSATVTSDDPARAAKREATRAANTAARKAGGGGGDD